MSLIPFPQERTAAHRAARVAELADSLAVQKCIDQSSDMLELLTVTAKHDVRILSRAAALLQRDSYIDLAVAQADQVARLERRTRARPAGFRRDQVAPDR